MNSSSLVKFILMGLISVAITQVRAEESNFAKKHPRRAEVNKRERHQKNQINKDEKDGKITKEQGDKLKQEEAGIKNEERNDVKANGGHLTKAEQKKLNKELNQEHKEIKADEKQDAGAGTGSN